MKKILSLVLAGLLLIGLAGCSGALHDAGSANVVGYRVINSTFSNGTEVFVLSQSPRDSGNAQPGNTWGTDATIKGTQVGTTVEITCPAWAVNQEVNVQVKNAGASGINWGGGLTTNAAFEPSTVTIGADHIIEIDMAAGTAKFVKK